MAVLGRPRFHETARLGEVATRSARTTLNNGVRCLVTRNVMGYAPIRDPDISPQRFGQILCDGSKAGIQAAHAKPLSLILGTLNAATTPGDMGLPGLKLHPLKGGRSGTWSVTVRANWRITFRFDGKDLRVFRVAA